jgi:hypothetical protein
MTKLAVDASSVLEFSLINGRLKYKNRIWVGNDYHLQLKIVTAFHSSAVSGHSGISIIYHRVKKLFALKGLKYAIQEFVLSCLTCEQSKSYRAKSPGLLQPLSIPDGA